MGLEKALKELQRWVGEDVTRVGLLGALLLAKEDKSFCEGIQGYENENVSTIYKRIQKSIASVIDEKYSVDPVVCKEMKTYYKTINKGLLELIGGWYNPLYTVVKEVVALEEDSYKVYTQEIGQREKGINKGYTQSLLGILINMQQVAGENTLVSVNKKNKKEKIEVKTMELLGKISTLEVQNIENLTYIYRGIYQRVLEIKPKEVTEQNNEEILRDLRSKVEKVRRGGEYVVVVPLRALYTRSPQKEELLKKHTLESVISLRVDGNLGYDTLMCIVVMTAHKPHPKDKETYFAYWGSEYSIEPTQEELNEWLDNYKAKRETKGHSINKKVTYQEEWSAEAQIELPYTTEGYNTRLEKLFKVIAIGHNSKPKNMVDTKVSEEYIPVLGTTPKNKGVKGYVNKRGLGKKITKGECIVFNSQAVYYQEDDFLSNAKLLKLEPRVDMGVEELMYYVGVLEKNLKRFDYSRTATATRVNNLEIPKYTEPLAEPLAEPLEWLGGIEEQDYWASEPEPKAEPEETKEKYVSEVEEVKETEVALEEHAENIDKLVGYEIREYEKRVDLENYVRVAIKNFSDIGGTIIKDRDRLLRTLEKEKQGYMSTLFSKIDSISNKRVEQKKWYGRVAAMLLQEIEDEKIKRIEKETYIKYLEETRDIFEWYVGEGVSQEKIAEWVKLNQQGINIEVEILRYIMEIGKLQEIDTENLLRAIQTESKGRGEKRREL